MDDDQYDEEEAYYRRLIIRYFVVHVVLCLAGAVIMAREGLWSTTVSLVFAAGFPPLILWMSRRTLGGGPRRGPGDRSDPDRTDRT